MEAGAVFRTYVKNGLEKRDHRKASQIRGCAALSGLLQHTTLEAPKHRALRLVAAASTVALLLPRLAVAGQAAPPASPVVLPETHTGRQMKLPPQVEQARRFLSARGLVAGGAAGSRASASGTASFAPAQRVSPWKVRLAAGRVAATLSTTAVQT